MNPLGVVFLLMSFLFKDVGRVICQNLSFATPKTLDFCVILYNFRFVDGLSFLRWSSLAGRNLKSGGFVDVFSFF